MSKIGFSKKSGFTIVEILIVIIVIGILATIVAVVYNGAADNARNSARIGTVNQMVGAVRLVLSANTPSAVRSSLNFSDNWYRACIGTGYTDLNGDGLGDCAQYGGSVYVSESSAFQTLLKKVATVSGTDYETTLSNDGDFVSGPYLAGAWIDSKDMLVIEYSLEGEGVACGVLPLAYYDSEGNLTLNSSGGSPDYTSSGEGVTECMFVAATSL